MLDSYMYLSLSQNRNQMKNQKQCNYLIVIRSSHALCWLGELQSRLDSRRGRASWTHYHFPIQRLVIKPRAFRSSHNSIHIYNSSCWSIAIFTFVAPELCNYNCFGFGFRAVTKLRIVQMKQLTSQPIAVFTTWYDVCNAIRNGG